MKKLFNVLIFTIVLALPMLAKDLETNYRNAIVMAYSPANSVYEDDNIKLEIYGERLWATNKTDRTIFIDLSQCFLVHNGSSYPMFSKGQDEKIASKKKFSTSIEEFISIAPSVGSKQNETFICDFSGKNVYGKYTTTESPSGNFSEYEERLITLLNEMLNESLDADPEGKNYIGTVSRHLTEDESINCIGANISYAFNKKSEDWTPVTISTWVSDVCFAPFYVEMPQNLKKDDKSGFGIKKTEAAKVHIKADSPFEFDTDKSPLIVCDWVGNFKKGSFELYPAYVSRNRHLFGKTLFKILVQQATYGVSDPRARLCYKQVIIFDGKEVDWGEIKYANNPYNFKK
ncbi:MAG: hypothetical protein K2M07_04210 [Muribaculaceae bacterium]|nr:hypothetical protein [Muribaculaceae bacterium]